jgi:hypothetical protein
MHHKLIYTGCFKKSFTPLKFIVYLDMLQEFLIPQLDEDDQEGCIHFQQDGKKASCKSDARDAT